MTDHFSIGVRSQWIKRKLAEGPEATEDSGKGTLSLLLVATARGLAHWA